MQNSSLVALLHSSCCQRVLCAHIFVCVLLQVGKDLHEGANNAEDTVVPVLGFGWGGV